VAYLRDVLRTPLVTGCVGHVRTRSAFRSGSAVELAVAGRDVLLGGDHAWPLRWIACLPLVWLPACSNQPLPQPIWWTATR